MTKALVIAHGAHESGRREIPGIDVSEAETEAFWTEFPRDLVTRGLTFRRARRLGAIAKVVGWRLAAPSRTRTAPLERCGVMLRRHSQGGQAGRGG